MDVKKEEFDANNNSQNNNENISMDLDNSFSVKRTSERIRNKQMNKTIELRTSTFNSIASNEKREQLFEEKKNFFITSVHQCTKTFECSECPQNVTFESLDNLTNHILQIHREVKAFKRFFKCPKCQTGFFCNLDLRRHIALDHLNVKILKCKDCGAMIRKQNVLKPGRSLSKKQSLE